MAKGDSMKKLTNTWKLKNRSKCMLADKLTCMCVCREGCIGGWGSDCRDVGEVAAPVKLAK